MTTTTPHKGRLGNQIIRNLAVSIIAEKFNLKVNYSSIDIINKLGIDLYCGNNIYNKINIINDNNYFLILNSNNINYNLNPNNCYFQSKEVTNFLYDYLHKDNIKEKIMEKNPYNERYNNNEDIFIHIRLTDVAHLNPGINYYIKTINTINKNFSIYISTDDINHNIITELLDKYPNIILINYDEINTIQFASTCKNIILSHGSFSAIIGYLAFFSNIYYPEYDYNKLWYGDMFSINNWIKITN